MKRIINIVLYILCMVVIAITLVNNTYIRDIIEKKEIINEKSFNSYFDKSKLVCIDLKDSKETRFKEEKSDSIVYISSYGDINFISVLTKGTSLSDKVCGEIKNKDSMSIELKDVIEKEDEIKLSSKYFTNYKYKQTKNVYLFLLVTFIILFILFIFGIIANIISLKRKEF